LTVNTLEIELATVRDTRYHRAMKRAALVFLIAFLSILLLNGCMSPPYDNPGMLDQRQDIPPASGSVL
jgi:hypothetical protein